jgi:hypothetical protein
VYSTVVMLYITLVIQVKKILPFSGELDIKNEPLDNEDGAATVHRLRYIYYTHYYDNTL